MTILQQPKKGQFTITIPKNIVDHKRWRKGTVLLVLMDAEETVFVKESRKAKK